MKKILPSGFIKLPLLLLLIGLSFSALSQQAADTVVDHRSAFEKINDKMEWIVKWFTLPVVSYNTETNWLFGLTKFNSFKLGKNVRNDSTVPSSTVTGLAYYTLNNQYKFVINSDLFFGKSGWRNYSQFIVLSFPSLYYGTGNDTKLSDKCLITFEQKEFMDAIGYKIYKKVYTSLIYRFKNFTKINYTHPEDSITCPQDSSLYKNEGIQSGLGLMLYNEARDNNINAHKGSYLVAAWVTYNQAFGSDFNFSYFLVDYRKYFPLAKKVTLATQFYSEVNWGDIPVQSLALMGGGEKMRGIYLGRYRDKLMTIVQAEIRFPVYWIISAVAFGGVGEVAPDFNGYTLNGIHWSAGAGLRLMVDSQHKANIRFDYGISKDQHFFFFGFGEAF
jgi:hypothetical protein